MKDIMAAAPSHGTISWGSGISRGLLVQSGVALLTLILVMAPLGPVLWQSFIDRPLYDEGGILTLGNYRRLFATTEIWAVMGNSLLLAVLSTFIAGAIGVTLAIILERTDVPGRGWLRGLTLWPMYLSHIVIAFSWFIVYGPAGYVTILGDLWFGKIFWSLYTIPGMAIVAGTSAAPFVYLFCSSSARLADATLEDAGRSLGAGPLRVLFSITLPLMRPALIYACLLTFIGALEMLSVPLVFGRPVGIDFFTTYLYDAALGTSPDYGLVGAAATLLLAIIIGLLLVQGVLLRNAGRFVTMKGKAQRPKLVSLGRMRWVAFGVIIFYNLLVLVLPLIGIIARAFTTFLTPLLSPVELLTLDHFRLLFAYPEYVRSMLNSLLIAVFGGAAATLFVAFVAIVAHRSPFRFGRQLEFLALSPRAIPGIVASLGLFWAIQLLPLVDILYGTVWILMLAFTMRAIPTAYGAIAPSLFQIAKELDQGARACGADWWTTSWRVVLPLLKPALFSAYVLLFLSFMKEYSSAVFLFAPGSEVIGTTMLSFWGNGDTGPVSALSVIQLLITVLFVIFARIFLRTHRDG